MDTSVEAVSTDKLGRRSGPRRKYTIVEKRAIVEETQRHGASVAEVAQRHHVRRSCRKTDSPVSCLYSEVVPATE